MDPSILIVTASDEPNVKNVLPFLDEKKTFRLDTDHLLNHSFSSWLTTAMDDHEFQIDGVRISLRNVRSVWYRRPSAPKADSQLAENYREFAENESKKFLHALWSILPRNGVLWVNDPSVLRELEFNKPYQAKTARRIGLTTPETLITNDPKKAKEFFERLNGDVAIKTFGGNALRDEEGAPLSIFTHRLPAELLEEFSSEIRYAPIMLQQYVPKAFELRVTAVGSKLFACAIHSQDSERTKDDWRHYDFENVKHEPYELPEETESKLHRFMKECGIVFGAIDMIVTPENEHVFLEVNPSGQWGWIERLTGMPIAQTIAEVLQNQTS